MLSKFFINIYSNEIVPLMQILKIGFKDKNKIWQYSF